MTDGAHRGALRWLLLGSIGLNIALLAALLLPQTGWLPSRESSHVPRLFAPMALRKVLTQEQRELLRPKFAGQRPVMREKFREARAARRELDALLRQPRISRAELETVLANVRAKDAAAVEAMHLMITETLLELDAGQRSRLADQMAKPRERNRDRDRDRDRDHEPDRERTVERDRDTGQRQ